MKKKPSVLLFILHDDQIAKQWRWQIVSNVVVSDDKILKPQWELIKAWMVVDFTWSNAKKWIWKSLEQCIVLDDKIQKHNWMKEGLHVVIWGDKFLKQSKMEWKKKALNFCCSFWHNPNAKQWRWEKESSLFLFGIIKWEWKKSLECCSFYMCWNAKQWRWKRVLNLVVLDDRIQKHNWMKNGLNVVIKDDRKF